MAANFSSLPHHHTGSKKDPHLFAVTKGAQELHQHTTPKEAPRRHTRTTTAEQP